VLLSTKKQPEVGATFVSMFVAMILGLAGILLQHLG
jgi:hypothetical protein